MLCPVTDVVCLALLLRNQSHHIVILGCGIVLNTTHGVSVHESIDILVVSARLDMHKDSGDRVAAKCSIGEVRCQGGLIVRTPSCRALATATVITVFVSSCIRGTTRG